MALGPIGKAIQVGVVAAVVVFQLRGLSGIPVDAELWAHSIDVDKVAGRFILGIMLTIAALLILLGRNVARSQSEGARRLKLILKVAAAIFGAILFVGSVGPGPALVWIALAAIIAWVYKGYKNKG